MGENKKREATIALFQLSSFLQGFMTRRNRVARERVLREEKPKVIVPSASTLFLCQLRRGKSILPCLVHRSGLGKLHSQSLPDLP